MSSKRGAGPTERERLTAQVEAKEVELAERTKCSVAELTKRWVHLGFLGDRTARCGSRSFLKSPDEQKVTCRTCQRAIAGAPSLEQLLAAAIVQWGQRVPAERALEIAQGQRPSQLIRALAQEIQHYFADGDTSGQRLVIVERIQR
jgi:hypothetical protein